MIFISLIAISAVSATDEVADIAGVTDIDSSNVTSVENEKEISSADIVENENIISVNGNDSDLNTPAATDEKINIAETEDDVVAESSNTQSSGINISDIIKEISTNPNINITNIIKEISTNPNITLSGIINEISTNPNITLSGIINEITSNPNIDLTNIIKEIASNPNIDLTNIIKEIASNPNIDLTNIIKEITSNPNIDLTSLLSGSGLSIIDIIGIMGMFTGGDKYSISSADVTKYYTQYTTFKVTVMNGNKAPSFGTVIFTVDNNRYAGHIRSDGVASVKIKNLKPGTHYIISEYSQTVVKNTITVKKSIITKNVSKKYKKAGQFKVKILNSKGKAYSKQSVKVKFKGKTYTIKTKSNGIATFKLPKNLKVGKYTIKTTYQGLTVTNKITVKK